MNLTEIQGKEIQIAMINFLLYMDEQNGRFNDIVLPVTERLFLAYFLQHHLDINYQCEVKSNLVMAIKKLINYIKTNQEDSLIFAEIATNMTQEITLSILQNGHFPIFYHSLIKHDYYLNKSKCISWEKYYE
jgi:hypothetical protein